MGRRRRRPRVPGINDTGDVRRALRGLDGSEQLRAALAEVRTRYPDHDLLVVNNGGRGPMVIDTRAFPPGGWVLEGLIPTGVIAALADLDDPSPRTLLENGFDVVLLLELRGAPVIGEPVGQRAYFHPRLGLEPPAPFAIRFNGSGWERA
jgi:hypothetical protein